MAYKLNEITIRTDNSEGGMAKINEIWNDIVNGKLPLLLDSEGNMENDVSLVAKYCNYENDENGDYDLTIMGVTQKFFEELEQKVMAGAYKKYDVSDDNFGLCAKKAWEKVWADKEAGKIERTYSEDFECTVPAQFAQDGTNHCYLYIAVTK